MRSAQTHAVYLLHMKPFVLCEELFSVLAGFRLLAAMSWGVLADHVMNMLYLAGFDVLVVASQNSACFLLGRDASAWAVKYDIVVFP